MRAQGLFHLAGAVLAAGLLTAMAQVDQPNIRWGMSQTEVEAAVPGARPIRWGRTENGAQARTQATQRFGALELPARYSYDDSGLARVSFEAPLNRCRELAAVIIAENGDPVRFSDQTLVQLLIWHQPDIDRRLRLVTSSAGFCNLVYEPLAGFLEHDLASAPN